MSCMKKSPWTHDVAQVAASLGFFAALPVNPVALVVPVSGDLL
jgi:hypothetical protein